MRTRTTSKSRKAEQKVADKKMCNEMEQEAASHQIHCNNGYCEQCKNVKEEEAGSCWMHQNELHHDHGGNEKDKEVASCWMDGGELIHEH